MPLTPDQEQELIQKAQTGTPTESKDAINQLLECHRDALYQYAMKAVGDHDKAEDAVQATMIVMWQELVNGKYVHKTEPPNHFRRRLLSICKNRNHDVQAGRIPDDKLHYRTKEILREGEPYQYKNNVTRAVERVNHNISIQQTQDLRSLAERIDELTSIALPPARRRVFRLYAQGYTYSEIARYLNLKPTSVRTMISQAKRALKDHIQTVK